MNKQINVVKRKGHSEPLDLNKLHKMVAAACEGISNVSASQVEMNSGIQFHDGIKTSEIQDILIRSASDLISTDSPNYQFVAARLLLYSLYKEVWGGHDPIPLRQTIDENIKRGVYDAEILNFYSDEEIERMNSYVNHDRDEKFTYAGLRQIVDKYLVQDRSSQSRFETPQTMYILIAATMFANYPKNVRMNYVRKYYDAISLHKLNLPTPVMAGVRTPLKQFASCVLVDSDDTIDSIFASDMAVGYYTAQRSGIGYNTGRIRGKGAKIRGGEVEHTGLIPFLKKTESTVRCCTQNGVRGGSATVHIPIWHQEIEDIIVLKNNKGTEDNRVRKLDYSVQMSGIFYKRYLANGEITLFSPHDVPGLYEAFGTPEFDALYEKYERAYSVPKKKVSAKELFSALMQERAQTGRIYIMNHDHANTHSSFLDKINMSNLCQEITLPTTPIQHIDDENGEIALCILSAINLAHVKDYADLEPLCDLAVRSLEELIDLQNYPVKAAEKSTKARRSLGIGYINLAYYFAKRGLKYSDNAAAQETNRLTEAFQYYLLKASNQLAIEKGACTGFSRTKYSQGILPIDTYKKDVDDFLGAELHYDWEALRADIVKHGLRHSTLTAQMPSESSSVVSNATNGVEPPRDYISVKKSKQGPLKQIVPEYSLLKGKYELLWDIKSPEGYLKIMAAMQKYFDQSISVNTSYNPEHFEGAKVPLSTLIRDVLLGYKWGLKNFYYQNTYDSKEQKDVEYEAKPTAAKQEDTSSDSGCDSGSCAI